MKRRIYAGSIEESELKMWKAQMKYDGFDKLWTWVCWVIRQHIQKQKTS